MEEETAHRSLGLPAWTVLCLGCSEYLCRLQTRCRGLKSFDGDEASFCKAHSKDEFPELSLCWSPTRQAICPWPDHSLLASPACCKLYGCASHDSSSPRYATAFVAPLHWFAWEPISIVSEPIQCFRWPCGVLYRIASQKVSSIFVFKSFTVLVSLSTHFMHRCEGDSFALIGSRILCTLACFLQPIRDIKLLEGLSCV